jgi:antirestriction protein ArdC
MSEITKSTEFRFEAGEDLRERVMKKLEEGVKALFETDQYKEYLLTMSKFYDYSLRNTILLYLQKPDVQVVAGFRAWQEKFDRSVKKGERGLKIIVPHPYKEKVKDEKTGAVSEIERLGFGIGTVFDVSQTEGKPIVLEQFEYKKPNGEYEHFDEIRSAIEQVAGIPVTYVDKTEGSEGAYGVYIRNENRIEVINGMSQEATLETLIHETAHSMLHNDAKELAERGASRRSVEVEAESVSFVVCDHLGIDTSGYSFAYVAGWSKNKTLPELQDSAERIHGTAQALIEKIDKSLGIAGRNKKQEEQKTAVTPARSSRGRK